MTDADKERSIMIVESIFTKILLFIKSIQRKYKLMNQYCKCCGREMSYDFSVSDEDWEQLPLKYHNHVLCIHCFCEMHPNLENVKIEYYRS